MRGDLDRLMTNLASAERSRLTAAVAADPDLADGLSTMLADLPLATQERLVHRIAVHLAQSPLGGGAVRSALTDVIEDALRQDG